MSIYPNTATLAAFRHSCAPDMLDCLDMDGTRWTGWATNVDGASAREREYGIGRRDVPRGNLIWSQYNESTAARREASAERNNRYWSWTADRGRLDHDLFTPGWSRLYPMSRMAPHDRSHQS